MTCDLHIHSVFSDGTLTPREIIDKAIDSGLSAIALTDHNTIDGLSDFISASKGKNIEIVLGSEFSVDYNGTELHMLGLFIDPEHFDKVTIITDELRRQKEISTENLVESLNNVEIGRAHV